MHQVTYYVCDICKTQHESAELALECEAKGRPELPPYLASRIGQHVAAFGESRIVVAILESTFVEPCTHNLRIVSKHYGVSGNQDFHSLPIHAFDPMDGYDFLRYQHGTDNEFRNIVLKWKVWCLEYGIEPNPRNASWWGLDWIRQNAILESLQ